MKLATKEGRSDAMGNALWVRIILWLVVITLANVSVLCCADGITGIEQCMNTNLTADILRQFPCNATSTVQNCVLAFVKGSVNGDLRAFVEPFSAEIRLSEFGIADLGNISAETRNEFLELMTSVSNCTSRVVSYNEAR